jgi:hypothetical protein
MCEMYSVTLMFYLCYLKIRLNRISEEVGSDVLAKAEWMNPGNMQRMELWAEFTDIVFPSNRRICEGQSGAVSHQRC